MDGSQRQFNCPTGKSGYSTFWRSQVTLLYHIHSRLWKLTAGSGELCPSEMQDFDTATTPELRSTLAKRLSSTDEAAGHLS